MSDDKPVNRPRAFISYSWTSEAHKELVRSWADRLLNDGVEVVVDVYDLKEGDDKHKFMERSVRDPQVSHVLIICDKAYTDKADARKAGVGTETQLISKEVYDKTEQSKFIPILYEFTENGEPYLPAFLASRIGIDFSTPEKVNANWEQLVRLLYGKPLYVKPAIGTTPLFLAEASAAPPSPARAKFEDLRQAIVNNRPGLSMYRTAFLNACFSYADKLRVRARPEEADPAKRVLEDVAKLVPVRDHIVDWVLLEGGVGGSAEFVDALLEAMEQLKEVRARPAEVTNWDNTYFLAHELFAYETFLYIVAALLKTKSFAALHELFSTHYLRSSTDRDSGTSKFDSFGNFYAHAELLQSALAPAGRRLHSAAAALLKQQAQRSDISFKDLIEADLLATFVAWCSPNEHWFPQLMYYSNSYEQFPFFLRATQHKHFKGLATITGLSNGDTVREAVKAGMERTRIREWPNFWGHDFGLSTNLDKLDTIK